MRSLVIKNYDQLNENDSLYYILSDSLKLDKNELFKDINRSYKLKELCLTKDIVMNMGIHKVPTFIINGNMIDDVRYIERFLSHELN